MVERAPLSRAQRTHPSRTEAPMLSFEKLDVFQAALEFRKVAMATAARGELRDQLERATSSVVLNIAEGAGRWQWKDKRRFYDIARGSAMESAAVLLMMGEAEPRTRQLAERVVAMLTRLCSKTAR